MENRKSQVFRDCREGSVTCFCLSTDAQAEVPSVCRTDTPPRGRQRCQSAVISTAVSRLEVVGSSEMPASFPATLAGMLAGTRSLLN